MQVDELMAEMGWVRRLARGLLRDGDAANDIAQDAWLVASEHAPEDGRPLRPWLHRVVTNLVRMRRRTETRREARELASGEERAVPSPEELLERVETQRVLAVEVTALREPYRSTLLLHYVEGLASAEIARRLGIPSATVRQRLKHGLDELRDRLRARTDGPKQGWLAALLPLAKVRPEPALAVGALAMKKLIAIGIVLLVLLAGGVTWRVVRRHAPGAENGDDRGLANSGALARISLTTTIDKREVALPGWLAQVGAPSRRLSGRVIFEGRPVAHAVVRIGVIASDAHVPVPATTPGPPFVEVGKRVTDERGQFDFGLVPAATFVVSAEADGKAPTSIGVSVADPKVATEHILLVLGACRTHVSGIVRDTVSPIARARLKVAGLAGAQSDDAGRFGFCMPFAKSPNIRVEADGYGTINVQVPAMYGEIHRDFILVPEATIEGLVVDDAGAPVEGAVVSARPAMTDAEDEASAVETVADPQGRFRITGLAPTKYSVGAFGERGQSVDRPVIVVAAGTSTRGVRLVIAKRARLRGRVAMAGAPVAGARLGVEHDGNASGPTTVALSQADGSFTLDGAPLGSVRLVAEPYEVMSPAALTVRGDVDNLMVEVVAKASIHGRVTRHGLAVADARVELLPAAHPGALTSTDGDYVLDGLPAGNFDLFGSNPQAFTTRPVTLAAGESQQIDLELDSGGEVFGTVVDRSGAPVSGVLVRLVGGEDACRSFTDVRGAFDCATLAGHRDYQVAVFPGAREGVPYQPASGGEFAPIHVDNGDTVVRDVKLAIDHDERSIRGRVVDANGVTVPDARVTVEENNSWGDQARTRAGEDGGFIIDGLASGFYDLRARLADGSVGEAKHIAAGATGVTITLVRPGTIEGTLVGFTTVPMVIAAIGTWTELDIHEAKVTGDHFAITGLKPASYMVQALVDGVQLDGTTAEVRSNEAAEVTLHARPRSMIDGRVVTLGTTAPVARMRCRAAVAIDQRPGVSVGRPSDQLTDGSGRFTLDAPVGRTRVECEANDAMHSAAGANIDVPTTGATGVELASVALVTPGSNPGFVFEPTSIPPTVLRARSISPVRPGDVVVAVDGIDVSNMAADAARALLTNHRPGESAAVSVLRATQPVTLRVTVE